MGSIIDPPRVHLWSLYLKRVLNCTLKQPDALRRKRPMPDILNNSFVISCKIREMPSPLAWGPGVGPSWKLAGGLGVCPQGLGVGLNPFIVRRLRMPNPDAILKP